MKLGPRPINHHSNQHNGRNENPSPSKVHQIPGNVDQLPAHTNRACKEDNDESNVSSPLSETTWQLRKRHTPDTMETALLQCHPPHCIIWPTTILVIPQWANTQYP